MRALEMKQSNYRQADQRDQAINGKLTYQRLRCCGRVLNDQKMDTMVEQAQGRGKGNGQGLRNGNGRGRGLNNNGQGQSTESNQGRGLRNGNGQGRGLNNSNRQGRGQRNGNGQCISNGQNN